MVVGVLVWQFLPKQEIVAPEPPIKEKEQEVIVVPETKKLGEIKHDDYNFLTFSPDSQRFAYIAESERKEFIVLDGIEQERYDMVSSPTFSSNSQRFAYVAASEGKRFIVLDGIEQEERYDEIHNLQLSENYLSFNALKNKELWFVVIPF